MTENTLLLDVQGLYKTFAVPVLVDLNFTLRRGEIHALMGSNGAGKSTLSNIICGIHQPTQGNLTFEGKPHTPGSVKDAEDLGIRMVMQELNLFPTLSIAENLGFKHLGGKGGWINHSALREKASKALETVGLADLDPDTPVSELGVGQQQLIEIARVLADPVKLLILDEPTAALTDPQIELLFDQLNKLREQGVGIIYISHRMDEIRRISDRISILRDGQLVATENAADIDEDTIVNLMAGNVEHQALDTDTRGQRGDIAMKVENLSRKGAFEDVSLDVHQGEVLGIGGLIGSGRTELLRAIFGADVADAGSVKLASDNFQQAHRFTTPQKAISAGIGMVVEDRKGQGLHLSGSLIDNMSICKLNDLSNGLSVVDTTEEEKMVANISERLAIKYTTLSEPISNLSGGNQQKALIARWLLKDLPILLFDEPSRGVDARAKARIHDLIREQAAQGKAVIVISSETQELMGVSDRIVVMSNGKLAGEFDPQTLTEEQLLEASFRFYSKPQTEHKEETA
ncbi:sugar ABC transporter ATP-binding protein [Marinibactrum halimedae]|uniref:Sugar ABC transporter ATP-binding protein n=1 Tax=Marinibactrum halimedae TaxID=1444977 RepID=A0AA37WKV9_9GAMM|nr:sugar ABC transporter ATP-binding protein [Marinibactrum halimedae]MCD9458151.1 sugar ABC transporter ATP-binding protein [Marinibactrum halimedae]GLS25084.1 sugar ABC transporter ATP-binding protein [Marinibactrum halimedae]